MVEYRVNLDVYNGPLDLLLYLIRRDELDIHDIPVARITEQYLQYVDLIKELDIDGAGEFLVMAATLMEIKSVMLLPREEGAEAEDDLTDPRLELVRQLLEYKKYKDIAADLGVSALRQADRFSRPLADLRRIKEQLRHEQELELDEVQIWDLFDAFNRLMQATLAGKRAHEVIYDDTPIDLYEADILDRAQQEQPLTFQAIFEGRTTRIEIVGLFLALLELVRLKLVRIEQEKTFGTIYIFALTEEPAELAVAHAVSADIEQLPSRLKPSDNPAEAPDEPSSEEISKPPISQEPNDEYREEID